MVDVGGLDPYAACFAKIIGEFGGVADAVVVFVGADWEAEVVVDYTVFYERSDRFLLAISFLLSF